MDAPEEEVGIYDQETDFQAPTPHHGADLEHIAAVLADSNPSSGQLQGRRIPKQGKRRSETTRTPGIRAKIGRETRPSGRHVSTGAAKSPPGSCRAAERNATGKQRWQEPESCESDWEELDGASQRASANSGAGPSGPVGPSTAHKAHVSPKQSFKGRLKHPHPYGGGTHPFYDRPGLQETDEALFCEACGCWVPSAPDTKEEMWREHLQSKRHAREAASRLREEATRQSTHHYRSNVLPAMKHAAEELRCLGVSGAQGAGPSLRQAARSAAEVLRAGDQTSQQISKLHADAMRELVHHAGGSTDFQRLATRLARERLACAWPVLAAKQPRPADNTLLVLGATAATIACLAAQLPDVHATTVVISLASMHALDLAPTTTALCLLARSLAAGSCVQRLQVSLLGVRVAAASAAPADHAAERDARLIGRFISELNRTVAVNCSLRLLSLRVMEPRLVAREWAEVQASAVHAAPRQRAAVASALHPRVAVSGGCPLRWLPLHIFKEILDLAVPITPCKVVLR